MKQSIHSIIVLILSGIIPDVMYAQSPGTIKNKIPDSSCIERMSQYLTFKLSVHNDIKGFVVKNVVKYDIQPNDKNALTLSMNYRWLSLSYSAAPKFIPGNDDDALKGKTKTTAFALNFNFDHWIQNLSYDRVKGYYLDNTSDYLSPWVNGVDSFVQFPNLVYNGYSGQTAYKFNKNFSFNALNTQTERQLKSAGTFMPAIVYNYYIVDDKTPLTGQNSSQKSNNLELLLAIGYFHTFIIQKKFYISAGVIPAAGIIMTKLLTRLPGEEITNHYTNVIFRFKAGCALGYSSERFFAGTQLIISDEVYSQAKRSNVIINDRLTYQVFAGYRFIAPKFLKRTIDKADEKRSILFK